MASGIPIGLVLRQGRLIDGDQASVDIGVADGRIVEIASHIVADAPEEQLDGRLVIPGFVETHIHLDKSCILDRCDCPEGTLQEAIASVATAKCAFTEADVYARAQRTLEKSIVQGTTRMRTHVEVDPRVGLRSYHALRRLKRDYAWAIDLQICAFPQEGLTNDPGTEEILIEACEQGADVIGGCPYTDTDPPTHMERIFDIARRFDLDIDFHLDFDLDHTWMHLDDVCRLTDTHRWGGRVAVGHVTKLSAITPARLVEIGARLANAGVAVTVLPATDLFLMGRGADHNVPRGVTRADRLIEHGVTCSLATNNVLNAFTPFGDASLLRMANLYANIAQLGREEDLRLCFDMITSAAAALMNQSDLGLAVGKAADLLVLPCDTPSAAVAEIAHPVAGFKRGRRSFTRPPALLNAPGSPKPPSLST
jgi:cytosine/creatinine deaminase